MLTQVSLYTDINSPEALDECSKIMQGVALPGMLPALQTQGGGNAMWMIDFACLAALQTCKTGNDVGRVDAACFADMG
jgi:hypothetical protein